MSMLLFMPWCRINKAYKVGDIDIPPLNRHDTINGLDDAAQCSVNTIIAAYKTIEGKPVDKAALIRYASKPLIDDLNEDALETVHELAAVACFCGLAKREYFNPLVLTATTIVSLFISRSSTGRTLSAWPIDDIAITIPVHCHGIETVSLDEDLLKDIVRELTAINGQNGRMPFLVSIKQIRIMIISATRWSGSFCVVHLRIF